MNGAHLHLIVNHLPLFALLFGLLIFVVQFRFKSIELRLTALAFFVIAGACSVVAVETGESAEKILTQAVPETQTERIEEHEKAADFAQAYSIATAIVALALVIADRYKPRLSFALQILLLVSALMATSTMARTAYLGGQIRHSEIRETS